jgi:hypothetical protein
VHLFIRERVDASAHWFVHELGLRLLVLPDTLHSCTRRSTGPSYREQPRATTTAGVRKITPTYNEQAHYLRQYVKALRHNLENDPTRPRHLITEAGMGYRFQP